MRARELLQEDYNQSLQSDLENILVAAKGAGASDVETAAVVNQLYSMGYSVNSDSILQLLGEIPIVMNATPETITMTQPDGASTPGAPEDNATKVADMAQNATDLG